MASEAEHVHPETAEAWVAWLREHHGRSEGVWVVSWRRATGRPVVPYDEIVCEALAWGWIDGPARPVDGERSKLRFAPRSPRSAWSRPNKERVARLEAEGRMQPAGAAVVERAKATGTWTILDAAEALEVPEDLERAFADHPGSRERWEGFPPSARRAILGWIAMAKRPPTREKRVTETARLAQRGERANQWRPPPAGG